MILSLLACAKRPESPAPEQRPTFLYSGPDTVELDLLRVYEDGPKIYVQVRYPDDTTGVFMVDTGAAVSVIRRPVAERLGLELQENYGEVEGLGGRSSFDLARLPALRLGDAMLTDVEFAVGVRGIQAYAGNMPQDGILGNNIWQRFVLEVDYPADRLVLHRPGTVRFPRRHSKLVYDGAQVFAPLVVTTDSDPPRSQPVFIQVDTGAYELLLAGATGRPFEHHYTEGEEPVLGIGASEYMPSSEFLRKTRRIPVRRLRFGGQELDVDLEARWLNFDGRSTFGPAGMQGLAGHNLMANHTAFFDYVGGRFALRKSRRRARDVNGHRILLEQDIAAYGADPQRALYRAQMNVGLGETDEAIALLDTYLALPDASPESIAEARVLLARLHRLSGSLKRADLALAPLGAGELVDEQQLIAAVNGLLLEDETSRALALAREATQQRPQAARAHVALGDALLARGDWDGANDALLEAARHEQNPDAHLLRRARVALARGDRYGAMARIRRLIQLYPSVGPFLWFYSTLVEEEDRGTFRHDLAAAMERLHPRHRPVDFLMAAHRSLGDGDIVKQLRDTGIERDCEATTSTTSRDNCLAWYWALSGYQTEAALRRIERALDSEGARSDFLDTKAMVHLARGELEAAYEAALAAARLSPDDIYMLWQAERIGEMSGTRRSPSEP